MMGYSTKNFGNSGLLGPWGEPLHVCEPRTSGSEMPTWYRQEQEEKTGKGEDNDS
ncbi:hypothetical protein DPMN_085808 [Dreissena polymorpha]|uniref:Uncharacterized protein n=1 Tax=Dreissena polymorpha TaxID=45954 RepID=A0A9D4BKL4_DREPO|nr:hypothetical protein DPMN_085808 [Dreissena polymorpha]